MLHAAPAGALDPRQLYALLRLRSEVFVVEQACAYLDLDGRDVEPGCVHLWIDDDTTGEVLATARLLEEPGGLRRIGRVCTAEKARGQGLAARLVQAALERGGHAPTVIDAQSHLTEWYARFGFVPTGHDFVEDGIPHTEMKRP